MPSSAKTAISSEDADVFVSPVSGYEIVSKFTRGKLPQVAFLAANLEAMMTAEGFRDLPLTLACEAARQPAVRAPRDPFDRLLIAQALVEGVKLVSNERMFDAAA